MATFRDSVWNLSPSRLRTYWASRLAYAFIGYPLDIIAEAAREAARVRFPTYCPPDALPYHGRDRGIARGPGESEDAYRARLLSWRSTWNGSGVGRAMLDEIAAFLTPAAARLRIWTQTGVVYTRETDGTFVVTRVSPTLWNWDGRADLYMRFWVVIYSVGGVPWSRDGTWNDGEHWGDNATTSTWGSTATQNDVAGIRAIIDSRKPAQSVCTNIIISFDSAAFSPTDSSPPLPDGNWANFSKNVGGVQVPSRDDRAIYWQGVP